MPIFFFATDAIQPPTFLVTAYQRIRSGQPGKEAVFGWAQAPDLPARATTMGDGGDVGWTGTVLVRPGAKCAARLARAEQKPSNPDPSRPAASLT
jgi:hypothetical protein